MNLIKRHRREGNGDGGMPAPIARLWNEVDTLFDRFFQDPWGMSLLGGWPGGFPRIDLAESEDEVTVCAELPGVDPNDVEISVVGDTLTIRGEKRREKEEKDRSYHYEERQYGSFHRAIELPSSVDPDKVDASYKNGMLTVTVAKRPEAKPKKIPVKTA